MVGASFSPQPACSHLLLNSCCGSSSSQLQGSAPRDSMWGQSLRQEQAVLSRCAGTEVWPCYTHAGESRSSFWIHSLVLNSCSFLKSVSSPNPLEVGMTLSTGYISSVVTEGNKHADSCALICEKYLASKCLSYFLGSLKINCLIDFWAVDRQRGPWLDIMKREKHPLSLVLLPCWLQGSNGRWRCGLEHDPRLGVLCASTRAGGNTSCAFSAGEKASRGMRMGFSLALTGRIW